MQYGVRTRDGKVHTEKHWLSPDQILKGSHGHGIQHIGQWGVLVAWDIRSGEWKEVHESEWPSITELDQTP